MATSSAPQSAYLPSINALRSDLAMMGRDPAIAAYSKMLAGMPTAQGVSRAYGQGLNRTVGAINKTNFNAGAKGASSFVGALASALGLGGAGSDVAASMQPSSDNSLVAQAMRAGAGALYSGSEAQRMQDVQNQRMVGLSNLIGAKENAFTRGMDIRSQLANVLGQWIAAGGAGATGGSTGGSGVTALGLGAGVATGKGRPSMGKAPAGSPLWAAYGPGGNQG